MPTYASMLTGGDGWGVGLRQAGYECVWGVEMVPEIAEVATINGAHGVIVARVQEVDYRRLPRPDLLVASPECKEFSAGKTGGEEGPEQIAQARAVVAAIEALTPPVFALENVVRYRHSRSLAMVVACLDRLGYMVTREHVNCADVGVPQTRRRLLLRAVRGGLVPTLPTPVPWIGWYAAIADLIPTLPESEFAPWQIARLAPLMEHTLVNQRFDKPAGSPGRRPQQAAGDAPAMTITTSDGDRAVRAFLVGGGNTPLEKVESKARDGSQPAFTVFAGNGSLMDQRAFLVHPTDQRTMPVRGADEPVWTQPSNGYGDSHAPGPRARAFIVDGQNSGRDVTVRQSDEPVYSMTNQGKAVGRAFIVSGQSVEGGAPAIREEQEPSATVGTNADRCRAWLEQGRVVAMTPRAIARFQSFPDSYMLPERKGLALVVLGNAVPPLLARVIGESLRAVLAG